MKKLDDIVGKYTLDEMICPKCKIGTMKEFVLFYRCRNLDCRVTVKKYFQLGSSK
jgi:hypothetical protein